MKHFYQKKRNAKEEDDTSGGGPTSGPAKQQVKRFRLLPQGLQDLQEQSRPRRSVRPISNVDPSSQSALSGFQHDTSEGDMNSNLPQSVEISNLVNQPGVDADAGVGAGGGGWQFSEPWPYDIQISTNDIPRTDGNGYTARFGRDRQFSKGKDRALSTTRTRNSVLNLSAGQLIPLAVLPDGAPPRTRMLIHHYCKSFYRFDS